MFEYDSTNEPGHEEVVEESRKRQKVVADFVCRMITRIAEKQLEINVEKWMVLRNDE